MRLAILLLLSSCSLNVDYTGTYFECGEGDTCPDDYVCKSGVCIPTEPAPQTCSRAIAAGDSHTCMIREPDGSIWCWGRNNQGQLGNGSIVDSTLPVEVPGLSGARSVVAGREFTCALVGEEVLCWGANDSGQLGDNSNTPSRDPIAVQGLTGATALAAGGEHTCAIVGGGVQCWGDNEAGQLGDTTTAQHRIPAAVTGLSNATVIAAYGDTTCAVTGGTLACWGSNRDGQFMTGGTSDVVSTPQVNADLANVTAVAVGEAHVCAVAGGAVKCGGSSGSGQLGNGVVGGGSVTPADAFIPATIVAIFAGFDNTCAIDDVDRVWCWGSSSAGKLFFGEGVSVSTSSPVITAFEPAQTLAMGGEHTCVRTIDGAISCAGTNGQGQLGNGTRTTEPNPIDVDGLTNVAAIASGDRFTCAATMAGEVSCWGLNSSGQLGNGGFEDRAVPTPALIDGVATLHAGAAYVCAESTDGSIACWGEGDAGQLGAGTATRGIPFTIPGLANVDALSLGDNHTCVIAGGALSCFGDNGSGKLGDAAAMGGPTPVPLNNGIAGTINGVAQSASHTCVIDSATNVQCWGADNRGTLGRGTGMENFSDPAGATVKLRSDTATALANVDEIASRGNTVYARQGGSVFAWGNTCPNILGASDVTFCNNDAASSVDNITNAKALAIGFSISCVLKEDGGISCWGQNNFGQIGDGTYNFTFAVAVPGLTNVLAVAPGSDHVCAIKSDRTVACWGNASHGQLGNRVLDDRGPAFVRLTCQGT